MLIYNKEIEKNNKNLATKYVLGVNFNILLEIKDVYVNFSKLIVI